MNRGKLAELRGKYVGLWPLPRYFDQYGNDLGLVDNNWYVREATRRKIELQAVETEYMSIPYILELEADHIHEFRSASGPPPRFGILVLHSQVLLQQGKRPRVEPITHRQKRESLPQTQGPLTSLDSPPPLSFGQILFFALGGAAAYALISGK
jgi:hypothetical protein